MNKKEILVQLIEQLKETLETVKAAAESSKDAATNEESKAENKYDTRGLEASYLAGAQAKRADELRGEITHLQELELKSFTGDAQIKATALVQVEIDGETQHRFFILPTAGGSKIEYKGEVIQVITPSSPVGTQLMGQKVGGGFELKVGEKTKEYEVLEIL